MFVSMSMNENSTSLAMPHMEIYTDCGCEPNPGPGGYGVVLIHPKRRVEIGGFRETTNNRMEIFAESAIKSTALQPFSKPFSSQTSFIQRVECFQRQQNGVHLWSWSLQRCQTGVRLWWLKAQRSQTAVVLPWLKGQRRQTDVGWPLLSAFFSHLSVVFAHGKIDGRLLSSILEGWHVS